MNDLDLALDLYATIAAGGVDERLVFVTIPGAPASKSRPRFGRGGHVYDTAEQRAAEERTGTFVASAIRGEAFTGNVALGCVFFRPNKQRVDTDNMVKHVCDAANKVAWADDSQVTAILAVAEYDPDNPRTLVVIGNHVSTLQRGSDSVHPCAHCGTPISSLGASATRRTCSKDCSVLVRGARPLATLIPCPSCSELFRRVTKEQKYCSPECGRTALRNRPREAALPRSRCLECDVELTHTRGGRCRSCWITSAKRRLAP